jgi:glyoxylase-like metal-dependent hydrolase (beta-lactamase superfamily II)
MRRSCSRLESLTHKLNKVNSADELRKWGANAAVQRGIPQKSRTAMSRISVIHESPRLIVAGRNRCNNFNGNQYCIISKATRKAALIDMADDWADDWHIFLEASDASLEAILFTHLHLDCLLGLDAMLKFRPATQVAFHLAERYWVDKYQASCWRYGRHDLADKWLPFDSPVFAAPATREARLRPSIADSAPVVRSGLRGNLLLLTGDPSRSTPSLSLGPDLPVFHIYTPGHSLGHVCYHLPQEKMLFTGDMLFFNQIGRVDLPNASGKLMAQSLRQLEDFPDNTILLPGHGKLSTLKRERAKNPALARVYELMAAGVTDPSVGFTNRGYF